MLKAGFISLGCSKNLVDTEVMLGILAKNNIEITAEPARADILIVNTCTFIQSAKEESITTILNMAEYKQEGKGKCLLVDYCRVYGSTLWSRIIRRISRSRCYCWYWCLEPYHGGC